MVVCFTLSMISNVVEDLLFTACLVCLFLIAHPLDKKKQDDEHIPRQDSDPHNPDTPFIYPVYILHLIRYLGIAWYSRCYIG